MRILALTSGMWLDGEGGSWQLVRFLSWAYLGLSGFIGYIICILQVGFQLLVQRLFTCT